MYSMRIVHIIQQKADIDISEYAGYSYEVDLDTIEEIETIIANWSSIILGLVALGIAMFIVFVTAMDIMYITIPALREYTRKHNLDGSEEDRRFKLVSPDAVRATNEFACGATDNAIKTYLGMRIKTYIIDFVIIGLIVGGSGHITRIIVSLADVIMKVIMGIE